VSFVRCVQIMCDAQCARYWAECTFECSTATPGFRLVSLVCDLALLLLGTGVKPGAKVKSCGTCGGQGAVNNVQRTPFGVFSNVQPCPKCGGSGEEVEEHCGACRGQGQVAETKEVTLKIPAGVESGSTMRLRDGGNAGEWI
jgi:hypothetical protein